MGDARKVGSSARQENIRFYLGGTLDGDRHPLPLGRDCVSCFRAGSREEPPERVRLEPAADRLGDGDVPRRLRRQLP